MNKDLEKEKEDVLAFFKAAFNVDGECRLVEADFTKPRYAVEMNDSKLGTFYIARLEKNTMF